MAIFRCAACGSQNVSIDTQAAGIKYDFVKGAVGTVLLGAGGAAAGITNNEERVYKCAECGITLTYPMPEDLKRTIDEGVALAESRNHLSILGVPVTWTELKKIYKNIESGAADDAIKYEAELEKIKELRGVEILKARGYASEEEFNKSICSLLQFEKDFAVDSISVRRKDGTRLLNTARGKLYTEDNLPSLINYLTFLSAIDTFITNYFRFRPYYEKPVAEFADPDTEEGKRKEEFRLLKKFTMVYIALNYYDATGLYAVASGSYKNKSTSEQFFSYVKNDPFYVQLLTFITRFDPHNNNYSSIEIKDRLQNLTGELGYLYSDLITNNCLIFTCQCSGIGTVVFPKYRIQNGALYYNNMAFKAYVFPAAFANDLDQNIEEFFNCFPDQKEKYDSAVSEHKRSVEAAKAKKEEISKKEKELQAETARTEKQISAYKAEAEPLRKKVFGKKKAEARIQELEALINQQKAMAEKADAEYKQLESVVIPEPESDAEFNTRMAEEYDYFLIWRRIDET